MNYICPAFVIVLMLFVLYQFIKECRRHARLLERESTQTNPEAHAEQASSVGEVEQICSAYDEGFNRGYSRGYERGFNDGKAYNPCDKED